MLPAANADNAVGAVILGRWEGDRLVRVERLAGFDQRQIAQVLAIEVQEIEGIQQGGCSGLLKAERIL